MGPSERRIASHELHALLLAPHTPVSAAVHGVVRCSLPLLAHFLQLSLLSKLGHQSEVRHAEGLLHQARDTRGSDARTPVMRDPWNGTPVLEPLTALPQAGAHAACKLKSWLERVCRVLTPVLGRAMSSRSGRASVCKR